MGSFWYQSLEMGSRLLIFNSFLFSFWQLQITSIGSGQRQWWPLQIQPRRRKTECEMNGLISDKKMARVTLKSFVTFPFVCTVLYSITRVQEEHIMGCSLGNLLSGRKRTKWIQKLTLCGSGSSLLHSALPLLEDTATVVFWGCLLFQKHC